VQRDDSGHRRRRLAEAVDVFCENIAFSPAQARQVFEAARASWLAVKIHAEQLSNQHGAELAASFGALSADHIEHLDDAGIAAMAAAGTVAVLLPGAFFSPAIPPCRRSPRCVRPACRWRWPPTAIRAPRR
jgi:imidazolonepropionase